MEKERYTRRSSLTVVDSAKMLRHNHLIDLRTHTRRALPTAHPQLCRGSLCLQRHTDQYINGNNTVVLKEGSCSSSTSIPPTKSCLPARGCGYQLHYPAGILRWGVRSDRAGQYHGEFLASTLRQSSGRGSTCTFSVAGAAGAESGGKSGFFDALRAAQPPRGGAHTMSLLLLELLGHTDKLDRDDPRQYDNACAMEVLQYIEEHIPHREPHRALRPAGARRERPEPLCAPQHGGYL